MTKFLKNVTHIQQERLPSLSEPQHHDHPASKYTRSLNPTHHPSSTPSHPHTSSPTPSSKTPLAPTPSPPSPTPPSPSSPYPALSPTQLSSPPAPSHQPQAHKAVPRPPSGPRAPHRQQARAGVWRWRCMCRRPASLCGGWPRWRRGGIGGR